MISSVWASAWAKEADNPECQKDVETCIESLLPVAEARQLSMNAQESRLKRSMLPGPRFPLQHAGAFRVDLH